MENRIFLRLVLSLVLAFGTATVQIDIDKKDYYAEGQTAAKQYFKGAAAGTTIQSLIIDAMVDKNFFHVT
ncbi:MAG: hypothetical protein QGF89_07835 [Candidatus Marinimicrobia bacterium]|jgi:hypothetical protein|nr:hypothetical protein [Candidatus Neomarinimicrobiota bacterium]